MKLLSGILAFMVLFSVNGYLQFLLRPFEHLEPTVYRWFYLAAPVMAICTYFLTLWDRRNERPLFRRATYILKLLCLGVVVSCGGCLPNAYRDKKLDSIVLVSPDFEAVPVDEIESKVGFKVALVSTGPLKIYFIRGAGKANRLRNELSRRGIESFPPS